METFKCLLCAKSGYSKILILEKFFRQNWGKERGVGTTLQKVVKINRKKTQPHLIE